ncbi:MAG: sulfate adenylyltransferase [Burkholderiales bacterium PBB4]|nr:MAG: sulfate adenylyltransferase [Burkholderiales bacterium PBB4]
MGVCVVGPKRHVRVWALASAGALACITSPGWAGLVDYSANLISYVENKWGREAPPRLMVMQRLVRDSKAKTATGRPDAESLKVVNGFFNQVPYVTDQVHWGMPDYWATPIEMLGTYGGDCEDYSIGKYLSLKEVGISIDKLRITYVRALRLGEAHMVLAYYPTPDAEPFILDNLTGDIKLASQRTDLEPVYSFNDDDLWSSTGANNKGGASNVRLWRDLLAKLAKEQKM